MSWPVTCFWAMIVSVLGHQWASPGPARNLCLVLAVGFAIACCLSLVRFQSPTPVLLDLPSSTAPRPDPYGESHAILADTLEMLEARKKQQAAEAANRPQDLTGENYHLTAAFWRWLAQARPAAGAFLSSSAIAAGAAELIPWQGDWLLRWDYVEADDVPLLAKQWFWQVPDDKRLYMYLRSHPDKLTA